MHHFLSSRARGILWHLIRLTREVRDAARPRDDRSEDGVWDMGGSGRICFRHQASASGGGRLYVTYTVYHFAWVCCGRADAPPFSSLSRVLHVPHST